jgi:hypothetical protein
MLSYSIDFTSRSAINHINKDIYFYLGKYLFAKYDIERKAIIIPAFKLNKN